MKFKDANNKVHEIDENFKHLLPAGCVEITDVEADELNTPIPLTPQEIDVEVSAEAERELNLSPKMKVILKQILLLRKANGESINKDEFLAELIEDYKAFK